MAEIHRSRARRPKPVDVSKDVPDAADERKMVRHRTWGKDEYRAWLKRVVRRRTKDGKRCKWQRKKLR